MALDPETKQKIQLVLALAILIAAARTGYVFYERHVETIEAKRAATAPALDPDAYVTPKKLYPYDLKSAKDLTRQPVWVKVGNWYAYYPYNPATRHADFAHAAGRLLPIQKLHITDVVSDKAPESGTGRQILAVFEQDGKHYAVQIGTLEDTEYKFFSDSMFFIEDPHVLYQHWPPDIWDAVEQHRIKPGMNELQADFAVGVGTPDRQDDPAWKTVHYPNGGKPLTVIYHNGRATEVKEGQGS
jgi:hypothetical protein